MGLKMFRLSAVLACFMVPFVTANSDPATGYIYNYQPTKGFMEKNQVMNITDEIQAAECASNTRLHFPHIQLFAYFKVNHDDDNYHGCPYGKCIVFTAVPRPDELEPSFTDAHLFFWHNTGGVTGLRVNPITNPQTGAFGYEDSLSGIYRDGKIEVSNIQFQHDKDYPTFAKVMSNITSWTSAERNKFELYQKSQPNQPKCGRPCDDNLDPGSINGAYGHYVPKSKEFYTPPPGSKLPPAKNCRTKANHQHDSPAPTDPQEGGNGNGNEPSQKRKRADHCKGFCKCVKRSQDGNYSSCRTKNNKDCSQHQCKHQSN